MGNGPKRTEGHMDRKTEIWVNLVFHLKKKLFCIISTNHEGGGVGL